jgi:hypothetical protein
MRAARSRLALVGFVGGAAAGTLLWSRMQRVHRRDLFSRQPLKRVAALGFLRGRPTIGTARLLREYIAWEPRALLRHRGVRLLRRIEAAIE